MDFCAGCLRLDAPCTKRGARLCPIELSEPETELASLAWQFVRAHAGLIEAGRLPQDRLLVLAQGLGLPPDIALYFPAIQQGLRIAAQEWQDHDQQ